MTIFSTSTRSCFSSIVAISNGDEVSELNVSCDLGEALIMTTHQHPKKYATYVDERVWVGPNIAEAKTTFDRSFLIFGLGLNPSGFATAQNIAAYRARASSVNPNSAKNTNAMNGLIHSSHFTLNCVQNPNDFQNSAEAVGI